MQGRYPGFGHPLYVDGDPRARAMLDCSGEPWAGAGRWRWSTTSWRRRSGGRRSTPTSTSRVAALGLATGMPDDAGEVMFTVARMAGWLAHAIEEYGEAPVRFRPRANYVPAGG